MMESKMTKEEFAEIKELALKALKDQPASFKFKGAKVTATPEEMRLLAFYEGFFNFMCRHGMAKAEVDEVFHFESLHHESIFVD